jgi:hypothetical protein
MNSILKGLRTNMFTNKNHDQTLRHKEYLLLPAVYESGLLNHHAVAYTVSCWPLTTETWFQFQLLNVGIVVDKVLLGQGLLGVLQFYHQYHSTNVPPINLAIISAIQP